MKKLDTTVRKDEHMAEVDKAVRTVTRGLMESALNANERQYALAHAGFHMAELARQTLLAVYPEADVDTAMQELCDVAVSLVDYALAPVKDAERSESN